VSEDQSKLIERLEMEIAFLERGHASLTEERDYFRKMWQTETSLVVRWLRRQAESTNFRPRSCPQADAIERGEHRREEER